MLETTLTFGPDQGLIGTLTLPGTQARATPAPCGMVLFNAGVVPRIGPHRINVKIARELARHGIPTIRFDLHGMGDSLGADGRLNYKQQAVSDLQAAMDTLQRASDVSRFALLGFCSGALPSYWTAQNDDRVRHIILYDAFELQTRKSRLRYLAVRLRSHGFGPAAIALYLRRAGGALLALPTRLRDRLSRARTEQSAGSDDRPTKAQFVHGFAQLAHKGVHVSVLHSGADFSNVNHVEQIAEAFGADGSPVAGFHTGFLAPIDHIMTSVNAQRAFTDWICADLLGQHVGTADQPHRSHHSLSTSAPARSAD